MSQGLAVGEDVTLEEDVQQAFGVEFGELIWASSAFG